MSLNDAALQASHRKVALMERDFARFAVRCILAGVYLTVGTAFAGVAGQAVEQAVPGLGALTFALFFGLGLYAIIILNTDLATGNMMYMVFAATKRTVSWGKAFLLIAVCTLLNLVGAVIIAMMLGQAAKLSGMGPDHLIAVLSDGKLTKEPLGLLWESIAANFVVNMGVLGALFAKDFAGKFFTVLSFIAIFVGLGLEHVIANFSLFTLTFFSSDVLIDSMTVANVATNWAIVWVGNIIGGGFLIGGVYAWLNSGDEIYRD